MFETWDIPSRLERPRYLTVIVKQLITCKIIHVPFFSILEITSQKETMVKIKTFVKVANNVNKVGKGERIVLIL